MKHRVSCTDSAHNTIFTVYIEYLTNMPYVSSKAFQIFRFYSLYSVFPSITAHIFESWYYLPHAKIYSTLPASTTSTHL